MPELSAVRNAQLAQYAKVLALPARSKSEQESRVRTWEELLWRCSVEDPWFFLTTLVKTRNEHSESAPYEPFPKKKFLEMVVRTWEEVAARKKNRVLCIAKSRQLMQSWLACAMALWTAMTKRAQLVIIQSRKEQAAAQLIERTEHIWHRLPAFVQQMCPGEPGHLKISFPSTDSRIIGIPEGGDQIRSNTASLLIGDESAFQPEFLEAYTAAQPALEGGGMGVFISSAAPGAFADLVLDET